MFTQFNLPIGPFSFSINTDNSIVIKNLTKLYSDYDLTQDFPFKDFSITIETRSFLRRFIRPQVDFFLDEFSPFKPLPKDQSFAMLEWGMNWCIASKAHHYLILHAGTIEKNGHVLIMPAAPGSGKSTLTAAMVYNGWRLFSDELALVSLKDLQVYPCTRPINLKNNSIPVIQRYIKDSVFSSIAKDTHKGTVALLKPPTESVKRMHEPAPLKTFIFPKYVPNATAKLTPIEQTEAFQILIDQSFNYHIVGLEGFNVLSAVLHNKQCYHFEYSNFDDAQCVLSELVK
jgi:HprK-related kinase A